MERRLAGWRAGRFICGIADGSVHARAGVRPGRDGADSEHPGGSDRNDRGSDEQPDAAAALDREHSDGERDGRHGRHRAEVARHEPAGGIRDTDQRFKVLIDTHTADGLKVARQHRQPGVPMIVLETALPIKFAATIVEALGREPDRPAKFAGIEDLPKRVTVLPADAAQVKQFIAAHCA